MQRHHELELLDELAELDRQRSAFLDDQIGTSPVSRYTDSGLFQREREQIFRRQPAMVAHSSELAEANSFLRRSIAGLPLLLTRDEAGEVRAFINVCRHRGNRLVAAESGCKQRFSCPYHAWTWDNRGELQVIPHEDQGFPNIDKSRYALRQLACEERYGFIWVQPDGNDLEDLDTFLAGLGADLDWIGLADLRVQHVEEQERHTNWKILVEGGIEAYHFRVAHRKTIGPYFCDNLSTWRAFGPHLRSVLARKTVGSLEESPRNSQQLREHAQLLYTLFPASQLLVQSDHVVWIQSEVLGVDRLRIAIRTLVPGDRLSGEADREHWQKNHDITVSTLNEDFDLAEAIQEGLDSGANEELTFGRFEGALAHFNSTVDSYLAKDGRRESGL